MPTSKKFTQEEQILTLRYNQENSTISCPNCKSEVLYYDDYCYNCGSELKNSQKKKIKEIPNINKDLLFKYAGVCLVNEMVRNPFLFQEKTYDMENYVPLLVDKLLVHFKPVTVYEVLEFLLSEGYVVMLEGEKKYKSFFSHCNEKFLYALLNDKGVKPSSSKEENILLLLSKFNTEELENITSKYILENRGSNFFEVTSKGFKLVEENVKCLIYNQIFYDFDLEYYDNSLSESVTINDLLGLLDESLMDCVENFKWQSYSDLLCKYAEVYDKYGDMDKMLYYFIQHIICEFNPFSDNSIKHRIIIDESLKNKTIYALSNSKKTYKEFIPIVHEAYGNLKLPKNFVSEKDVELLLDELFIVPEIWPVNKHLITIYGFDRIDEELLFSSQSEQEKIIGKIENYST